MAGMHPPHPPFRNHTGFFPETRRSPSASNGARKLYQIITDKKSPDHTSSIGGNEDVAVSLAGMAPRDTLTVDDLNAEWHVPPAP